MMVRVDQTGHDDRLASVDDFGVVGSDVGADRDDAIALNEDVAGPEVWDVGIHRNDDASFEEAAAPARLAHGKVLPVTAASPFGCGRRYRSPSPLN
jgi:hypothetical protein